MGSFFRSSTQLPEKQTASRGSIPKSDFTHRTKGEVSKPFFVEGRPTNGLYYRKEKIIYSDAHGALWPF